MYSSLALEIHIENIKNYATTDGETIQILWIP